MKIFKLINFELNKILNLKKILTILIILSLTSFGLIKLSEYIYNKSVSIDGFIADNSLMENMIARAKKDYENDSNTNNLIALKILEHNYESTKKRNELNISDFNWKSEIFEQIHVLETENMIIELYLDGVDMDDEVVTNYKYETKEEAVNRQKEVKKQIEYYNNIFNNYKYYQYIETLTKKVDNEIKDLEKEINLIKDRAILPNYNAIDRLHQLEQKKNVLIDTQKLYKYIIENKIEDHNDWKYIVIKDILSNLNQEHEILDNEKEFIYNQNANSLYLTYEDYIHRNKPSIDNAKNRNIENWYYLNNNIKPLEYSSSGFTIPYNTRLSNNNVFYMAIVSLIITVIMCGGIIANEHKTGSIRLLLTKPYKRWKILLSKLLVTILIFLSLYLISIIITYILSGIMYGFNEFNIPLVINESGSISKISYISFTFKNILYTLVICLLFLSILFLLSSITLIPTISIAILLILIFGLTFMPYVISFNNSVFNYIPVILINYHEVIYPYLDSFVNINIDSSIINSIILSIIIIVITFIVYCKRDIKN
ncbi:MAG: ABC transporter permease subunit [Clostridium sp.]|nr:ABC transporter permease subunit [Clostridium sp.]MCM1444427.1 ABC transporter permease subunit [Candidatus Amulumruptor caecigallinarius]